MSKPVLQIIVASTRPGRIGIHVARWFEAAAREHGDFDVELVDLAEVALPLLNEPNHPAMQRYTQPHTLAWSETIERGDAYVIVHPEYNFSYNADVKNALDYLVREWADKPVAFVSYGGASGGLRARNALLPVVSALRLVPMTDGVVVPFVQQCRNEAGEFVPPPVSVVAAGQTLAALSTYAVLLRQLRTPIGA